MSMTRLTIVYTLNDGVAEQDAIEQLGKTQQDLPEGAFQQIARRNAQGMDAKVRWAPFGDLVQFIDFPHGWQAQEFDDSEAYAAQEKRTKGFFSNVAFMSCTVVDDMNQDDAG